MFDLSVHICTYNPKPEHLGRTLEALKRQTLSREKWELLLIDNASSTQTAKASDLRWHPNGRHLSETKIGKTNALLLAIREAKAELLLTVDDDNILEPDYLEGCLKIASEFPKLGAWGGQIIGEFEVPPPAWAAPHLHNLALYEAAHDVWSNLPRAEFFPPGAGMCFRRQVGLHYAHLVEKDPMRAGLDRQGEIMIGCGDTDLAFCSIDLQLGNGRFKALKLTHLIPQARTTDAALLDLIERTAYSFIILHHIRPESTQVENSIPMSGWRKRMYSKIVRISKCFLPREERLAREAALRGLRKANLYLQQFT